MTDRELESLIIQWKSWCYWLEEPIGPEDFKLGSAERFWRSPQCWEAPQPRPEEPRDWVGLAVERSVQKLPERHRAVLRMEYLGVAIYNGRRRFQGRRFGETPEQEREMKRRALHMAAWDYELTLERARIMLKNRLCSTGNKW